jgi:hypothetical protein
MKLMGLMRASIEYRLGHRHDDRSVLRGSVNKKGMDIAAITRFATAVVQFVFVVVIGVS